MTEQKKKTVATHDLKELPNLKRKIVKSWSFETRPNRKGKKPLRDFSKGNPQKSKNDYNACQEMTEQGQKDAK